MNKPTLVEFANVDHQLIFRFGSDKLTYDLGRSAEDAGERKRDVQPQVKIFGSGTVTVSHIAIFRDIHYTAKRSAGSPEEGRAIEGNPFTLGKDEFFVLGDNSPNSEDGRWWAKAGIGNNGRSYREGIVPRDYLVGKALFVYWPGGFRISLAREPENLSIGKQPAQRPGQSNVLGSFRGSGYPVLARCVLFAAAKADETHRLSPLRDTLTKE